MIGASVKRKEDPRLLTGTGKYVGDISLPGLLHASLVRSPHAHAVIRHVDSSKARLPGVVLVQIGRPVRKVIPIRLGVKPSLAPFLQPLLADRRVRYVGEPVGVIVASDRAIAEDAAELVEIEYEALPAVTDTGGAMSPDAPVLHERAQSNLADVIEEVVGEPDDAMATAEVRIRRRLTVQRHTGVPMETRGLVASYDPDTERLTVWGSTKVTHFNRRVLAGLLEHPEERIRFIEPEVGGGFGVRGEFYPEDFLVPWLAMRLERPVKWIEDRREHLLATNHSRQQQHDLEIGATRDGQIVALIDNVSVDMGAYLRTHGVTVPSLTAAMLPGPYRVPHYRCRVSCVMTNKTPTGTYRAPGRFEGNFARERMIDLLADAVGVDSVEIRKRNFLTPDAMPYDVGTAALDHETIYDTGDYASTLDAACRAADYQQMRRRQGDARANGRLLGVGVACFVEKAGPGPWEHARVEMGADGRATVYSGGASLGQGIETVLAQICAQELGVPLDDVSVVHGDTDRVPQGIGAWGSRTTVVGGSAVLLAAREVRQKLLARAAARLEAPQDDLMLGGGRVWVNGAPARSMAVAELSGAAPVAQLADGDLSATHVYEALHMTYPYGAHVVAVAVDPATGGVELLDYALAYDVGRAVNPMLVDGQLVGGLAQGVGGALLEDLAYAPDGQPLATTFMDYLLPSAMEMPARLSVTILEEAPTPLNPLGVKGAGEGGTAAAGAAIANAVADALRPLGVEITDLPLAPDRLWTLINAAKQRGRP